MNVLRLTLRQLQIFVAVAQTGSTTAAGDAVALSQSATSAAVNELERVLSLQLFDRTGKRLLLNDNGRALLPRALALLQGAGDVERMAHDAGQQLQSLRIGASSTIGNHVLPKLLADFLGSSPSDAPDWASSVAIGNTSDICAAVADFSLDIGLVEGHCHHATLAVRPWLRDELVLVAAPQGAQGLDPREPTSLTRLQGAVWLLRESGSGTRETGDLAILPLLHSYRRVIELGSSEAIKQAAAAGLGIACLSRWVVQDFLREARLVELITPLPSIQRQCFCVLQRGKQITPALARLLGQLGFNH
ncbi:MAG: LysR family transcriptional regulator [Giesbergeria sp.]